MEKHLELCWLVRTIAMTSLFWVPYVLERFVREGIFGSMKNPQAFKSTPSDWAIRAKAAHSNAIENLVLFAPVVLCSYFLIPGNSTVQVATLIYFFARLVHFISYTLGIFGLRTFAFLVGFGATLSTIGTIASNVAR